MVETQLCKLRGTSDTFVIILRSMVFVNKTYDMIVNTQFYTKYIVRACSVFYPYEGYRSVAPLDAAKVNRPIFHNHSVH